VQADLSPKGEVKESSRAADHLSLGGEVDRDVPKAQTVRVRGPSLSLQ
jgi:hypothetical protein